MQINERQQSDNPYRNILSRIRLRIVTDSDATVLNTIKIQFTEAIVYTELFVMIDYENYVIISKNAMEAVCLLSTCALCDTLNIAMLNRISSDKVGLIAQDITDCVSKNDVDSSRTADLAKIIIVKLGARVMIRRNIDVTLDLVNDIIDTFIFIFIFV